MILLPGSLSLSAQTAAEPLATLRREADILWTCIAAFMVFLMQAGFAYVEAGFIRARNVVNILMKNLVDFSAGSVGFWLVGFALMFGPVLWSGIGLSVPGMADSLLTDAASGKPDAFNYAFFLFQVVFCATAATIVSGAMAERTHFYSYIVSTIIISSLVYPVFGNLAWGNLLIDTNETLLTRLGFIDFAGSTVVHSVGGWLGLTGAIMLGPRSGKYQNDGRIRPIFGHNMSMAALGVFLLWFGWFGFNPGSTVSVGEGSFAVIAVVTNLAAATGAIGAMILSWILFRRPDISMSLNGALAGLVAITAGCYNVSPTGAAMIGLIAGLIVVLSVIFFDKIHIDDPVGAVSVHGVCGAWGTLAVAFFAHPDFGDGTSGLLYGGPWSLLGTQAIGVGIAFAWAMFCGFLIFSTLKFTIGLRVSPDVELDGLDIIEHGNEAYPEQDS
ncbi:MAG: ammonium transporter [Leptospiraceae bacterium]|nr:ammonium transporter [Leptospiraceae bacterium]